MQAILEQNIIARELLNRTNGLYGDRIGVFASLFGCWHKEMSRPFSSKDGAYRSCLNCGARQKFNIETFETIGKFYYPPNVSQKR